MVTKQRRAAPITHGWQTFVLLAVVLVLVLLAAFFLMAG